MKNLDRVLEVNENDNLWTAFAKGGAKGMIKSTLISGVIVGGAALVGILTKKDNSEKDEA